MDDLSGQRVDRYQILELLGQGGMASVYRAIDTRLEREVAIKFIRREAFPPQMAEQILQRFEREAKALARLSHPNIVTIYDYGEYQGSPYLVMQFVSGGTLSNRLGTRMSYQLAASLLAPIAQALEFAHQRHIIHRDVKPANILVTEGGVSLLSDFGISKILESESGVTLTGTGVSIGTPEYMAPEQVLSREVDGRADIYSLGVVFYELVTGHKPFEADTPMAVLVKHINDPLPRPRQFAPDLPERAEQTLLKALGKKPEERFASMAEFARALEDLSSEAPPFPLPVSRPKIPQPEKYLTDLIRPQADEHTILRQEPEPPVFRLVDNVATVTPASQPAASLDEPWEQPKPKLPAWVWGLLAAGVIGLIILVYNLSKPQLPVVVTQVVEVPVEKVVEKEVVVEVLATPVPTEAPTPVPIPARFGGWLDEIVFSSLPAETAIIDIQAGNIDLYSNGLPANQRRDILNAGLEAIPENGLYYELTFNPVGPVFPATGKFNPFSNPRIREAMNWLIDRDYLNAEVFGGAAYPKFLPITTGFPDYNDLSSVIRSLEARYQYDLDKARQVIEAEMFGMGTDWVNGRWRYQGEDVVLIFLIRNDSDGNRIPMGDYVADQLEAIGFTVDRQYKRSSEAAPLWVSGDPADGLWHIYTGAWAAPQIHRDADNLQFFYDPSSAYNFTALWQAYTPTADFSELVQQLAYNEFSNFNDRKQALARALELALHDSVRVWLMEGQNYAPRQSSLEVAPDLASGLEGSTAWPLTLRWTGQEGGSLAWGAESLLVDPWNPLGGSNWAYDQMIQRGTASGGLLRDPQNGLNWPLRIESATVTAAQGLPIQESLGWVNLEFSSSIRVPGDALVDWDANRQQFITAAEKFPQGTTALIKSVVTYPADLWETVTWHDGSRLDLADFIFWMILQLDPGKPESQIYDEELAYTTENFLGSFKGFRILSEQPLVIEWYTDAYELDAENNVYTIWPAYTGGEAPWHSLAVANLGVLNGELAYTSVKAEAAGAEWADFISGPSLDILSSSLDKALRTDEIPYLPTLYQYISEEEAAERYANLRNFYANYGHFWVGTGPYYLAGAYKVESVAILANYPAYLDEAGRWDWLVER